MGGRVAKSILHLLNAGCWAHKRQVSQTIDLVQYGAKNRASFDGTRGANGPKVGGGGRTALLRLSLASLNTTRDVLKLLKDKNRPNLLTYLPMTSRHATPRHET